MDENENKVTNPVEATSPVEKEVDVTKIVSARINAERAQIRTDALNEQAQSLGYTNHEEFIKSMTDEKITKRGFDPEEIKPLLKDLLENDPEYKSALNYKREKEEMEKTIWGNQEVNRLNTKYGTTFTAVGDLPEGVIKLWNSGIPLEKAYAVENIDKITELAAKKAQLTGKTHLTKIPATGDPKDVQPREVTPEEVRRAKQVNPKLTEEQIKAYLSKTN